MTPKEIYHEYREHECIYPRGQCKCLFEYDCPDCGNVVTATGEQIASNQKHGYECNSCYAYGPPKRSKVD
jgi:hypothetical protein